MDVNQYVICYVTPMGCGSSDLDVLLIEKNKPAWQAGKYNLPGGKIEPGETPHVAAVRELKEETDLDVDEQDVTLLGTIEGDGFVVYVMHCEYEPDADNEAEQMTDESIVWMSLYDALRSPKLIDNLRYIIPFCRSYLVGWTLTQTDGAYQVVQAPDLKHMQRDCPYKSHAYDCTCQGMGGDR